ncbi:hypothetical protein [Oceanihabitans sediminis]|uniref:Transposase n=1 Tax=Oceanihabitans sediminis TaxID=1812012 RepID=A0A368PBC6_9FLAO|nr:hypothetical protein [Oceanihabitans sediminis]MDX1278595.1 hypothetical protein [Oceanihabitans sediminis]MDX1773186.1 hypothetical protein [Oceanihabitans sediminis]RBP34878.1 hypothetical protein DFR65_101778 [Oceanihabitans sediminis]RCU58521.1 hypothetical protein DU428_03855 [Oceanihabitans sediminis]
MKTLTKNPKLLPSLVCSILGHKFEITKKVTYYVKEYKCSHCKKQVTTNSNGNLIQLTPKRKEINYILERVHKKKTKQLKEGRPYS